MGVRACLLALAIIAGQAEHNPPVLCWKFDGDAEPGGKLHGRASFAESPIGQKGLMPEKGQMLVLNGIDAFVRVDPAANLGIGNEDFTISVWFCPVEMRDATILSRPGAWALLAKRDGSVRFQTSKGDVLETPQKLLSPHRWFHLAVSTKRSEEGGKSGIWVNGERKGTGTVRSGNLDPEKAPLFFGRGDDELSFACGLVDEVRLIGEALEGEYISNLAQGGMLWIRPVNRLRSSFQGTFKIDRATESFAFVGGENILAMQDAGHLEAILSESFRSSYCFFHCLGWEGDTVYEQPRPLNFGAWRDQLSRVGAGVVFVQFGAMEALEGKAGLDRFGAAYDKLLEEISAATKRIVVLSPTLYERPASPLPDLSTRNEDLRLYVDLIRKIAAARSALFVDLFSARWEGSLTRDGIHLTESAHLAVAREIARQLGVTAAEPSEEVRRAIQKKNRLWLSYWRPSNWAFLNGDRIEQPSSRDHVDRRVRWFPVEVQETLAHVRRAETEIRKILEAKR
jgi:hypothetical protein